MQTEPQYVFTFLGFHALVLLAGLCIIFLGVLHRFWWNVLREFVSATIQKLLFINCYIIIWIVILCKSFVQVLRIGGMRMSIVKTDTAYQTPKSLMRHHCSKYSLCIYMSQNLSEISSAKVYQRMRLIQGELVLAKLFVFH